MKRRGPGKQAADSLIDTAINWCRSQSLWPLFFGLSCCFVEQATTFTSRYDVARFGSEVFRGSPRQADLLVVSGTVFKKIAPVLLRLYEQMAEPRWVISMGSCANTGGMYDVYSVVQGVDQIVPVDVYVPGCPPRPEALLEGLVMLRDKIRAEERPAGPVLRRGGGSQGSSRPVLIDGQTKFRDTRGPGMQSIPTRGTSVTPPLFHDSRSQFMWTPPAARIEPGDAERGLAAELAERFGPEVADVQPVSDMPTFTAPAALAGQVLEFLKGHPQTPFERLEDLTAVDESARRGEGLRPDWNVVYTLVSMASARRLRLKVPLTGPEPVLPSVTPVWASASWYEREVYDMFGVRFSGHPNLERLIMPHDWPGHPLRKGQPHRATELDAYTTEHATRFQPRDAGEILERAGQLHDKANLVLNVGPHHYSTHGLMRFVLSLRGEMIQGMDMDIGFHHRGVEKIAEHQSWHQFIPYTDRVDYLGGVGNNLSYLLAVERLAGVEVPERAQYIRVMLTEFYRISNHLLWLGTFVQDLGMMSLIFYTFREREMIMDIAEAITGARLHPAWFRIGGTAMDLPRGWKDAVDEFTRVFPQRIKEYEALITHNPIVKARTRGIGLLPREQAVQWGVTGPNLRASGQDWDLRRDMPYGGYERFDFEVPTHTDGDCYARYLVRMEEMRQSCRIIEQAARDMPGGRYVSDDSRYCLPVKRDALHDIESLIHHFINATRGPKIPRGEAYEATESPRGEQGYYVVSDGGNMPYRLHVRSPGYANVQSLPLMCKGHPLADFVAIIGSVDYILADIDR